MKFVTRSVCVNVNAHLLTPNLDSVAPRPLHEAQEQHTGTKQDSFSLYILLILSICDDLF